jgi:hypothetical protein
MVRITCNFDMWLVCCFVMCSVFICKIHCISNGICCFSAKHAALRNKNKDWLARNQNNVSEWSNISTYGLLFQWASTIKIQVSELVLNEVDIAIIILIVTCSRHDIDEKLLIWRETTLTHSAMVISYNYVILTLQFEETFQQYPPHPLYIYILYIVL